MGLPTGGLPPTLDFMRLLWAVDHGLSRRSKRMETELGVTGPQRIAVRLVARYPGILPSELAELLHIHRSTLTGILRRLQSRGFLRRIQSAGDGRSAHLEVTAKGEALDRSHRGTVEAAARRALSRVDEADVRVAARVLEVLATELLRDLLCDSTVSSAHGGWKVPCSMRATS